MNESFEGFSRRHREGLISVISAGVFLVLVGVIFLNTPNLFKKIINFFSDFGLVRVPNLGDLWLPAPKHPSDHLFVYVAVEQFGYAWGLIQLVILAFRFVVRSPSNKDAETASNIVFWVGTGFLTRTFLTQMSIPTELVIIPTELMSWFEFWSGIIMLLGVSLIIRAIVLAAASTRHVT